MRLRKENIFDSSQVFLRRNSGEQLLKERHDHDFYEIFLVTQGSLAHERNGSMERWEAGWMVFVRKEDVHCFPKGQEGQILNAAFSESFYADTLTLFGAGIRETAVRLEPEECADCQRRFEERMAFAGLEEADIRGKALIVSMLSRFLGAACGKAGQEPLWFTEFLRKIARPGIFNGTLQEAYCQTDRTPEHIARTFRRYRDMTLGEYLLELRLRYAGNRMLLSDSPIIEICYESGFQNLSYFYRCFRKRYGMTPLEYRRRFCQKI